MCLADETQRPLQLPAGKDHHALIVVLTLRLIRPSLSARNKARGDMVLEAGRRVVAMDEVRRRDLGLQPLEEADVLVCSRLFKKFGAAVASAPAAAHMAASSAQFLCSSGIRTTPSKKGGWGAPLAGAGAGLTPSPPVATTTRANSQFGMEGLRDLTKEFVGR